MAYDEGLADRIRDVLRVGGNTDITEKKMFGGVAFMDAGRMFCGIVGVDLMVRVGPEAHGAALAREHVRPMDFSGRPMKGYVYVAPEGVDLDADLAEWVQRALAHVATLPLKEPPASPGAAGRAHTKAGGTPPRKHPPRR